MRPDYKKQRPLIIHPPPDTPENKNKLASLVKMFQFCQLADGLRCWVLEYLQSSRLWMLTGTTVWGDFTQQFLSTSARTIRRMVKEGRVLWEMCEKKLDANFYIELEKATDVAQSLTKLQLSTDTPELFQNRKLLTALVDAPIGKRRETYEKAKAEGNNKDPKKLRIAAKQAKEAHEEDRAAKEGRPVVEPGIKKKPDTTPKELYESPVTKLRAALYAAMQHFVGLYEMTDGELTEAASSVYQYCRQVNREARKLR